MSEEWNSSLTSVLIVELFRRDDGAILSDGTFNPDVPHDERMGLMIEAMGALLQHAAPCGHLHCRMAVIGEVMKSSFRWDYRTDEHEDDEDG